MMAELHENNRQVVVVPTTYRHMVKVKVSWKTFVQGRFIRGRIMLKADSTFDSISILFDSLLFNSLILVQIKP